MCFLRERAEFKVTLVVTGVIFIDIHDSHVCSQLHHQTNICGVNYKVIMEASTYAKCLLATSVINCLQNKQNRTKGDTDSKQRSDIKNTHVSCS